MAKLSAHGHEVGCIKFLTYSKAFMSDGAILKNYGSGWKLSAKLKPGVDPDEHFAKRQADNADFLRRNPAYAAYKKCLHDLSNTSNRWKLHAAVELMYDDPDGVWSEACDGYGDNVHADVGEIVELCRLYQLCLEEQKHD